MAHNYWQAFSTDHIHPALRARRWSEFASDTLSEMVVEPMGTTPFQANLERIAIGGYGYARIDSTPAHASSVASRAGVWGSEDSDALVMTVAESGDTTLSQEKWSVELHAGDIAIRDLNSPWESQSLNPISFILLKIPFVKVARFHPQPEELIGKRLPASDPAVAFANTVIRASSHALRSDPEGDWHDSISDFFDDVLKLVCRRIRPADIANALGKASNVRREALRFIARNLHNPDLTPGTVAQAAGISMRHLQRLFLAQATTPRQYILDERLKLAAKKLRGGDPLDGSRIIDIAFEAGFSDASHFSRAFSLRYGCSPRDYRKQASTLPNPLLS